MNIDEILNLNEKEFLESAKEVEQIIAERIFEFNVIKAEDSVFGAANYVYDPNAEKDGKGGTSTCLVGGSWEKARKDGEVIEFYGCLAPAYCSDMDSALKILQEVEGHKFMDCLMKVTSIEALDKNDIFKLIKGLSPSKIARATLVYIES
ncbi:hypothetical protein JCM16358_23330 [Halanaerocella petrolearia]